MRKTIGFLGVALLPVLGACGGRPGQEALAFTREYERVARSVMNVAEQDSALSPVEVWREVVLSGDIPVRVTVVVRGGGQETTAWKDGVAQRVGDFAWSEMEVRGKDGSVACVRFTQNGSMYDNKSGDCKL